jgi:hypothetical protein
VCVKCRSIMRAIKFDHHDYLDGACKTQGRGHRAVGSGFWVHG